MSRRARLGFVAGCLVAFGLVAALISWGTPSTEPSKRTPATVTVTDLRDAGQLQARFNADQGVSGATVIRDRDRLGDGAAALLR